MNKSSRPAVSLRAFMGGILLLLTICLNLHAAVWTPDNLPMPYLQEKTHHTCNPDSILSTQAVDSINRLLTNLQSARGIQAIAVVVEHLEGDDPYAFNRDLFKKYGIGQRDRNNGIVITLATLDRSYQISPGTGLESELPDIVCSRIENRMMMPPLKEGKWDEAMTSAVNAVYGLLMGDDETKAALNAYLEASDDEESSHRSGWMNALLYLLAPIALIVYFIRRVNHKNNYRTCPHCGAKDGQKRVNTLKEPCTPKQEKHIETWTCKSCGKSDIVELIVPISQSDDSDDDSYDSSDSTTVDSGGTFGGGEYGGGGAGGRF